MAGVNRHQARVLALQVLYQYNLMRPAEQKPDKFHVEAGEETTAETLRYAETLVDGTIESIKNVEDLIGKYLTRNHIDDIRVIDRSILDISVFSLMFQKDVPANVVINEAVILAKNFGNPNSYKFINGILDAINKNESI
jgi:transcription antitermination protein NusB